jgi:hypothetical protein
MTTFSTVKEKFFKAVCSGDAQCAISLLEDNPALLKCVDDVRTCNSALHLAVTNSQTDLVSSLLNFCHRRKDVSYRNDFLHLKNGTGQTAYELSLSCQGRKSQII